jgi:hypothetical protein
MKGSVYGFWVEGVKVANGAEVTEMAEKAGMSKMAEKAEVSKGIWMTARHVICPGAEMAEVSVMTARHVMHSLGEVAV